MANDIFVELFGQYQNLLGLSMNDTLMLITVLLAVGIGVLFTTTTQATHHKKEIGLVAFFGSLIVFAFLGIINWIVVFVPFILLAFWITHKNRGGARS